MSNTEYYTVKSVAQLADNMLDFNNKFSPSLLRLLSELYLVEHHGLSVPDIMELLSCSDVSTYRLIHQLTDKKHKYKTSIHICDFTEDKKLVLNSDGYRFVKDLIIAPFSS